MAETINIDKIKLFHRGYCTTLFNYDNHNYLVEISTNPSNKIHGHTINQTELDSNLTDVVINAINDKKSDFIIEYPADITGDRTHNFLIGIVIQKTDVGAKTSDNEPKNEFELDLIQLCKTGSAYGVIEYKNRVYAIEVETTTSPLIVNKEFGDGDELKVILLPYIHDAIDNETEESIATIWFHPQDNCKYLDSIDFKIIVDNLSTHLPSPRIKSFDTFASQR